MHSNQDWARAREQETPRTTSLTERIWSDLVEMVYLDLSKP